MPTLFDDPADLDPVEILDWLAICSDGLERTRRSVHAALPSGTLPPGLPVDRLVCLSASEIDEYFSDCQLELDLFALFALIASAEARIRLNAEERVQDKRNFLGQHFAVLFQAVGSFWKVNIYENGIMDVWKDYIQSQLPLSPAEKSRMVGCIGSFKEVLDVRNWVAHGRYWPLRREITKFPPYSVAKIVANLFTALAQATRHGKLVEFL